MSSLLLAISLLCLWGQSSGTYFSGLYPGSCSFDRSWCLWETTTSDFPSLLQWRRKARVVHPGLPSPLTDYVHPGEIKTKGLFAYFDASNDRIPTGSKARLRIDKDFSQSITLWISYVTLNPTDGARPLRIYTTSNATGTEKETLVSKIRQNTGGNWTRTSFQLCSVPFTGIILEGTKVTNDSLLAVDSILTVKNLPSQCSASPSLTTTTTTAITTATTTTTTTNTTSGPSGNSTTTASTTTTSNDDDDDDDCGTAIVASVFATLGAVLLVGLTAYMTYRCFFKRSG